MVVVFIAFSCIFFFFQAEDGIRDADVTGVQTCALPISKAGDLAAARETLADAANLAKRLGDAERLARAAIGYGGWIEWMRAGGDRRVIPLLEDALRAAGDEPSSTR